MRIIQLLSAKIAGELSGGRAFQAAFALGVSPDRPMFDWVAHIGSDVPVRTAPRAAVLPCCPLQPATMPLGTLTVSASASCSMVIFHELSQQTPPHGPHGPDLCRDVSTSMSAGCSSLTVHEYTVGSTP